MISWFSPCAWSSPFWWPGESKAMVKPVLLANSPSYCCFHVSMLDFESHTGSGARDCDLSRVKRRIMFYASYSGANRMYLSISSAPHRSTAFSHCRLELEKKGSEQIRNTLVDGSPVSFVEAAAMCIRQHNLWHFNSFKHFYISFSHNEQLKFFISELS